jgi:hypothetical protein
MTKGETTEKRKEYYSYLSDRNVDGSSEEWRHECECRSILSMPSKEVRAQHLKLMEKHRPISIIERLKRDILRPVSYTHLTLPTNGW